jgi:ubiquinone/menaquinone biosynthesis C-methylase UbiE
MPDFAIRSSGAEIMDDLHASGEDLHQALHELDIINSLLGGNYVTLKAIRHVITAIPMGKNPVIADLGCGSGDMLKRIKKMLDKKKVDGHLIGVDANSNVIKYAREHNPASSSIQYEHLNIFSDAFRGRRFDVVTGTLFFHHFTTEQLIAFFKQLKNQTSTALVVNDIHRHWFSYYSIKWLTQLFSKSKMVKHDAPQSVLRAFSKKELTAILQASGMNRFIIKWRWAFRWQVIVRFQ